MPIEPKSALAAAAGSGPEACLPVASTRHTAVLLLIICAWAGWGYFGAQHMRQSANPHRMTTYAITAVWEWVVVCYIAWGLRRRGGSLRALIGGRWARPADFVRDWGISVGFWIVAVTLLVLLAHALHATQTNQNLRFLLPQSTAESVLWMVTSFTAGVTEEIIFRGYLQKQFTAWTRSVALGVLLSAVIFGAAHIYQGWKGVVILTVFGLLFGILAEKRKSLRPAMMAHVWHDILAGMASRLIRR
jgi:membrane protease YdiL (CAAX protease family)